MGSSFSGKAVVITGASRGIGLGVATAFANEGATLHLIADDGDVIATAQSIGAQGHICDITDVAALNTAFNNIPRLDVLINNAGYERMTPLVSAHDCVDDTFRRVIEINIIGTRNVTQRAIAKMVPGSSIVNTASIWGRVAEARFDAYVASKHAIIGMTKTWARELGPLAIRVNAVCPGWVKTQASMRSLRMMAERRGITEQALLTEVVAAQALEGLMTPDDMAETYLFLASDRAANITGQSLGVDRGEVPW